MKTRLVILIAIAAIASAAPANYQWWIRMIPLKTPNGVLSYEPADLRVEVRFKPIVTERADGVWEITFTPRTSPAL